MIEVPAYGPDDAELLAFHDRIGAVRDAYKTLTVLPDSCATPAGKLVP
jgi:hypothetical protein